MSKNVILPISKCFNQTFFNPVIRNKILKTEYSVGNLSDIEESLGFESIVYSEDDPNNNQGTPQVVTAGPDLNGYLELTTIYTTTYRIFPITYSYTINPTKISVMKSGETFEALFDETGYAEIEVTNNILFKAQILTNGKEKTIRFNTTIYRISYAYGYGNYYNSFIGIPATDESGNPYKYNFDKLNYYNIQLIYEDKDINYTQFNYPSDLQTTPYIFEIANNPLILGDTTTNISGDEAVLLSEENAKKINEEYANGKKTIELNVILSKYYDSDNKLVYDDKKGQYIKVGDTFTIVNDRKEIIKDLQYDNIKFVVTSTEFTYNGYPKLKIKGKEY